jgi:hypothetical protein
MEEEEKVKRMARRVIVVVVLMAYLLVMVGLVMWGPRRALASLSVIAMTMVLVAIKDDIKKVWRM